MGFLKTRDDIVFVMFFIGLLGAWISAGIGIMNFEFKYVFSTLAFTIVFLVSIIMIKDLNPQKKITDYTKKGDTTEIRRIKHYD